MIGSSKMGDRMCFECLQRRIQDDFSDKIGFGYGISDSALPFGSTAVVQTAASGGGPSAQFMLLYIPIREDDCLIKYIDEYCLKDLEGHNGVRDDTVQSIINEDQSELSVGILSDKFSSLETKSSESHSVANGGRNNFFASLGCDGCYFSSRFSCSRTITSLAPTAQIGNSSHAVFEELASNFLSGFLEDDILNSLSLLIEGKPRGRDSLNFLSLIGIPLFSENGFPGCIRHPNIAPVLGFLKTSSDVNLVLPKAPYTLENILHYSPGALKSDWDIRFLIYQLLSALAYMHGLGVAHGDLCPSNVMLTDTCWCWLNISDKFKLNSSSINEEHTSEEHTDISLSRTGRCIEGCPSQGPYADSKISQSIDWHSAFRSWWKGDLSNFDYLLMLNRLAGRRWGDHTFHIVMPWVIDFSIKPDENNDVGWRDLTKSKWRLAKGDEQLDFTYSTSEIPHHVSDECLSELAVCSYKARRLPLSILRMAVRSVYEPNEYPSTMQRLYQWTPDECIPEFYCSPQIFYSIHSGMSDLAVPSWAGTPEEFIKLHRDALESDHVSCQIHHWIDITFGYKMSGGAAVAAKNVMLPASEPTMPRSVGRRQLFTRPHPARRGASIKKCRGATGSGLHQFQVNEVEDEQYPIHGTPQLEELEAAAAFCEHNRHLNPLYGFPVKDVVKNDSSVGVLPSGISQKNATPYCDSNYGLPSVMDLHHLVENIEVDDDSLSGYQELLLWRQKSSCSRISAEDVAQDIFSVGCILAELILRRPLFDSISLAAYLESGVLPMLLQELPHHAKVLVETCIQTDWRRRPSAKSLLESPFFPKTVRSSYLFLAPLQLLAKDGSRLRYAASFAKQGVLRAMGKISGELCAPCCLRLAVTPLSDTEAEWAYILLKEFLNGLKPRAVMNLILPAIQKILQATGYSHLKVSLLQDSFVREIWNCIGKQAYVENVHPLVISNLYLAPHKRSAAAASVLLIGSSEELGVPITVHQTILPLIRCFGKGLCNDGIDVLVRIGSLFGENFVVKQMIPLLRNVVRSCINISSGNKHEPMQSWSTSALSDCLLTLHGLVAVLSGEVVVKELIEDGSCLYVQVLMQSNLGIPVLQIAATSLIGVCQQIGPDLTALHVLPKLKEIFDEFAFSQEMPSAFGSSSRRMKISKTKADQEYHIENRVDLVLFLYPPLASLLGIEKLRQCCATWLLLEQFLLRQHNWKWEYAGELSRSGTDNVNAWKPIFSKSSSSEYSPAKLLLNGVGWSIPQSQGNKAAKNLFPPKRYGNQHPNKKHLTTSDFGKHEPWHWFPSPAVSWVGPDFLGPVWNPKDELPWKIRASVIHSVRAHQGALRSFAICRDECVVFTAGVGAGFKGTVQKFELSRIDCKSGYYGHEEVVNDICVLASSDRVASCDGTVHIWNSQTGKVISIVSEFSESSAHHTSSSASLSQNNSELNFDPLSNGIMTTAFDGSLYTSMHHLEFADMLVMGTGNGMLRFIDINQGQKLHLWKSESSETGFSLISSICSCGSEKSQTEGSASFPSWIAAGLSSGNCRMLDMRSGNIIASWQAHDGYITKLAAPQDHLLVSSSLDKTLRIWDLRRNWPSQPIVYRGHSDSISGFSVWGQDVISISRNKIGLSSLCRPADEEGENRIRPQHVYMADGESKNMSSLSTISILPFSRLFLLGTEDGYFKLCS